MLYDISQEVFSCQVYPGDPTPEGRRLMDMEKGDGYTLTWFSMCAHNGTHVDAPRHFIRGGRDVGAMGLEPFVGDAWVADCAGTLGAKEAEALVGQGVPRLLLRGKATVTAEAARVFAGAGLLLLGCEGQSFGPEEAPAEVHRILLGAEVALLEGLRLGAVPPGPCFLSAAPLHLGGAEGAPVRAYVIV